MRKWWILLCTRPTRLIEFCILLTYLRHSSQVDMSLHSDKLYKRFPTNRSLLSLLNAKSIIPNIRPICNLWLDTTGNRNNDLSRSIEPPHHRSAYFFLTKYGRQYIYSKTIFDELKYTISNMYNSNLKWAEIWCSYSYLIPAQQFFSYTMARTSLFSRRWWWGSLCTIEQHAELNLLLLAHWNNSPRIEMSPHSGRYPDSEPTSLCSYSLMLRA